jgi:predicted RNase H-like HicB family nuclease
MKYPVTIHWVDDDSGGFYFAYLPDFGWSTVSGTGDTIHDALESMGGVYLAIVHFFKEQGRPIPEPTSPPFENPKEVV